MLLTIICSVMLSKAKTMTDVDMYPIKARSDIRGFSIYVNYIIVEFVQVFENINYYKSQTVEV